MVVAYSGLYRAQRRCDIPFFLERVSAGFPSPAQDYVEQTLDLNELCVTHPAATYFVRVQGDSMTGAGIFCGDMLVVDRSLTARHGDIVIAGFDGELTVKQLALRPRPQLLACNPDYPAIVVPEGVELDIFGVVSSVVRNLRVER
ncbi:SOS response UmuD protein [Sinobacterium caligoides]|uniref:SOS response UmuD protein n=1 Tax=Sinobacterium caligoides TaxID=933926 RepID=A0A3N2DE05_9GAMM|nr:translesion error-prone DNA polymerase V autoproteolytic subunit [Sinobacterium caligoides]ROR97957.1 SOS response UmuD protein [Sinobacterium caligoides]